MNERLAAGSVVEAIRDSRGRDPRPLTVFWMCVSADRDEVERDLRRQRGELALVPYVLRTAGFNDPDSLMNDVSEVLDRSIEEIVALAEVARARRGIDLVILSRRELQLGNTSSPCLLPEWFPVRPGQTTTVRIEDLTWSAAVTLSDGASGLDDLRRILYDCDRALLARLRASRRDDHRRTQGFFDLMLPGKSPDEELERIERSLATIRNPTGYRPSATKEPTVVGRLWAHANRTAPDGLPKLAAALAGALGIGEACGEESLAAVLQRPSNPSA